MRKTILLDLDGTLLPMDLSYFTGRYFAALGAFMARRGYAAEPLLRAVGTGLRAMVKNNGAATNEAVFWHAFHGELGAAGEGAEAAFADYYGGEFERLRTLCGFREGTGETVRAWRARGARLVLASNPVFPRTAQLARLRWAGMDAADFDFISSYENASFSKPNPAYFTELAGKIGAAPADCLMLGNDVAEDIPARRAGMDVFLVTEWLLNRDGAPLDAYPHGDFAAASAWVHAALQ